MPSAGPLYPCTPTVTVTATLVAAARERFSPTVDDGDHDAHDGALRASVVEAAESTGMSHFGNLLAPPTRLPEDPAVALLEAGSDPAEVAAQYPTSSAAWAELARRALDGDRAVEGYAYARTGYHRGLDALRRAGWKGQRPVPWEHAPNRGVLTAIYLLGRAAGAIGETEEQARCAALLADSDPDALTALAG